MNIFKPDDFDGHVYFRREQLADHANQIVKEWVEKNGAIVYGYADEKKLEAFGTRIRKEEASHQAIIIDIREIKPKICEH